MTLLLEAALEYARQGWPVFPVKPRGKLPVGRLVQHGFKDATTDEVTVRRWWKAEPDANIGTPTGVVFDAVDLDSNEAMMQFGAMASEHAVDLMTFPRARTGRGRHLLVKPTGVGNRVNVIPGMDWRGKGGYILLPTSVHDSGKVYEWVQKPDGTLPDCPDWLLGLLAKAKDEKPDDDSDEHVLFQPGEGLREVPDAYVRAAVEAELKNVQQAAAGTRNDSLNRAAFALGQMVGAGWLERAYAEMELRAAVRVTNLDIDDGEHSVVATIRSGLDAGIQKPREAPQDRQRRPPARPANGAIATAARPMPSIFTAAELKEKVLVRPRTVIPGMIQVGLTMIAGKGKLGKSWLALDVALAVASGSKALGSMEVSKAGDVLYLALEDNEWRMQERLHTLSHRHEFPARLHISFEWPKLDAGGVQEIEQWLREYPAASLVIIDVWKRLRHSRKQGAQLYDEDYEHLVPLQAIALKYGVAILVVHHTRKSGADDVTDEISGTGGILAALDAWIILHRTRTEADGELWLGGRDMEEAHLALRFEGGAWMVLGEAAGVTKSIARREVLDALIAVPEGMTPVEVALALGKPRVAIKQLIWKMFMEKELGRVDGGKYIAKATAVTKREPSDFARAFRAAPVNAHVPVNDFQESRLPEAPVNSGKRKNTTSLFPFTDSEYTEPPPKQDVPLSRLPFTGVKEGAGKRLTEVDTPVRAHEGPANRPCATCGSPTRERPTARGQKAWCDSCEGWAK